MKESINHLSVSLFKDKQKTVEKAIDKLKDMREVGQIKAFSVTLEFLNSKIPQPLPRLHMKTPGFKQIDTYIMDSEGFRSLAEQVNQKYGGKYAVSVSVTNTKLTLLVNRS